jgi:hypothetical protein
MSENEDEDPFLRAITVLTWAGFLLWAFSVLSVLYRAFWAS